MVKQNGQVIVQVFSKLTDALDLSTVIDELRRVYPVTFGNGAGAGQASQLFHDRRTLAASASEDLDLAGGGLQNAFGDALTFTRVKAIVVKASEQNTNAVRVSRPAANGVPLFDAAGDQVSIKPGGVFVLVDPSEAGIPVTADTGDLVTIANAGAGSAVTFDVIILGV